ncbi:MAG TPA: hypothetical protein VKY51_08210 [Fredinandcohnia sp.]|nr:hypothetical protein [Fredinandcohnia sp.]
MRTKSIRAFALGAGLLLGGGLAFAQGAPPDAPPAEPGPGCPGGCPLCEAHREAIVALNADTVITVEQQPNGAVVRFEAPAGDPEAIEAARQAAESYARALQAPQTRQGCPCPHETEPPAENESSPVFP